MTAALDVLVIALSVWAAIVGTCIGMSLWKWFWDNEEER